MTEREPSDVRQGATAGTSSHRGTPLKLFCLPHAGAGASAYARWPAAFGAALEVHAVQLPGRENRIREAPVIDPDALAATLVASLAGPFAIFGHSMGARVALEVVRRLRATGAPLPEVLYVSGCRAPDVAGNGLLDGLSRVDDDEFVARLSAAGGLPAEVTAEPELLELLLPTLRADFTWLDNYVHPESEPLPIPIVCFAGDQDRAAPVEEMRGWERQTSEGLTLHVLPGGHFFVRDHLPALANRIGATLLRDHRPAQRVVGHA